MHLVAVAEESFYFLLLPQKKESAGGTAPSPSGED